MADFRIENIKINPNYKWQDIAGLLNWKSIQSSGLPWSNTNQITEVNQPIFIEAEVIISSWDRIRGGFTSWQLIKDSITTWSTLKTW